MEEKMEEREREKESYRDDFLIIFQILKFSSEKKYIYIYEGREDQNIYT